MIRRGVIACGAPSIAFAAIYALLVRGVSIASRYFAKRRWVVAGREFVASRYHDGAPAMLPRCHEAT
jgi:hypothetical protein